MYVIKTFFWGGGESGEEGEVLKETGFFGTSLVLEV